MRHVLHHDTEPAYLNDVAAQLLHEGRSSYRQLGLSEQQVVGDNSETLILPWRGDRVLTTMTLMLRRHGVAAGHYGAAVVVRDTAPTELHGVLAEIAAEPTPDPTLLAASADGKQSDKYYRYLSVPLLNRAYASRHLDVPEAHRTIQGLAG